MLRQELPGLTEEDITWLSTMAGNTHPHTAGGGGKRRRANHAVRVERAVRRSPRHTQGAGEDEEESEEDTTNSPESDSGPSDTATAHGHLRPQLSRAFRALYGSQNRKGIVFGLQVLATFVQCLGEQFAHTSQDPVFYLRTADMKAGGKWKNVPTRFAYDQRQQTITATLTLNAGRDEQQGTLSIEERGQGPTPGPPP